MKLPFVIATSTYHHDTLTQPFHSMAGRRGWTMVDSDPYEIDPKMNILFWNRVFGAYLRTTD